MISKLLLLTTTVAMTLFGCSDVGDNRAGEKEGLGISSAASGSGSSGGTSDADGAKGASRDDEKSDKPKP